MRSRLGGILFDMDGVLIDSEPMWRRAEIEVFARYDIPLTEDLCRSTKGKRLDRVVAHFLDLFSRADLSAKRLEDDVLERMEELLSTEVEVLPGVRESLEFCHTTKLPWNVATSSHRRLAAAALRRLGIWESVADRIVTGDQVEHPKPAPDIFLEAARRIDLSPERCLVIEDSVHGCLAGARSGATVLVVPELGTPTAGLFGDADFIHERLEVDFLKTLFTEGGEPA